MEVNDITLARILECMGPQHGAIKALGEYIGISGNAISNWKLGKSKSYMRYLPQIARFYHVSEAYLRGEIDTKNAPTAGESSERNEKRELAIQITEDLSEAEIQQVQDYVAFLKSRRNQ